MAVVFLRKGSEHYDAEMAVVIMMLILGVIEVVIAVNALVISCSSDPPRQVKRNVFINLLSKNPILYISYSTHKNIFVNLLSKHYIISYSI